MESEAMKTTVYGLWPALLAAGMCIASAAGAERSRGGEGTSSYGQHSSEQKTAGLRDGLSWLPVPQHWQRPQAMNGLSQQRSMPARQSARSDAPAERWQPDSSSSRMSRSSVYDPSEFNLRQRYSGNCAGGRCSDSPYSTFSNRPYVPYDTKCPSGRCVNSPQGRSGSSFVPEDRSDGMPRPWLRYGDPGDLRPSSYRY